MATQPMLPKLTVGLDLGDTTSHYCALDPAGAIIATGHARTTAAALPRGLARWPAARVVVEVGTHSPWVSRLLAARSRGARRQCAAAARDLRQRAQE